MSAAAASLWKKRGTTYSESLCGREISVVTYNTLADVHTRTADNPHCKEEYLFRKNDGKSERHRIILEEVRLALLSSGWTVVLNASLAFIVCD